MREGDVCWCLFGFGSEQNLCESCWSEKTNITQKKKKKEKKKKEEEKKKLRGVYFTRGEN